MINGPGKQAINRMAAEVTIYAPPRLRQDVRQDVRNDTA
jgi:hypothetical protein